METLTGMSLCTLNKIVHKIPRHKYALIAIASIIQTSLPLFTVVHVDLVPTCDITMATCLLLPGLHASQASILAVRPLSPHLFPHTVTPSPCTLPPSTSQNTLRTPCFM